MLVKVNDQYLEGKFWIDVDRKVKLFEEAGTTQGDISYDFEVEATAKNKGIFELYSINQSGKIIYSLIPATLESDNGQAVYFGHIRVQSKKKRIIHCYFFSGNANWFNLLNFKIRDVDYFDSLDVDHTYAELAIRETAASGIFFPVFNTGALTTRSYRYWLIDEAQPFVYVHSIILALFNRTGLKLAGGILNEWRYTHAITSSNSEGTPQEEINNRSANVNKSTTQTVSSTAVLVTFANTTEAYYPGDLWNTGTHRFTADYRMVVEVTITATVTISANDFATIQIFKNGNTSGNSLQFGGAGSGSTGDTKSKTARITLDPTDYIDFRASNDVDPMDIDAATITIKPVKIYRVFTRFLLPDVTAAEFVGKFFALFNPVINYDPYSQTITVDLFKKFVRRAPLDISKYINGEPEIDYTELVQDYGKLNNFLYEDSDTATVEEYNKNNSVPFGGGQIDSENEYLIDSADVLDSIFVAAIEDTANPFKTFLPHLDWRSLKEGISEREITITNSSGALFTHTLTDQFQVGDLIRVENSTVRDYNGEYVVTVIASSTTFRVGGISYEANATADITKLSVEVDKKDEQALLLALPDYPIADFTNNSNMFYGDSSGAITNPAIAYFYKPLQGLNIDDYKESLSFGDVEIVNAHQITMLESYWKDFEMIVRDPVKATGEFHFTLPVYNKLFDGPLRLSTVESGVANYFCNRVVSYQGSHLPCEVELIKISAHSQDSSYTEGPAPDAPFDPRYQAVLDYATLQGYTLPSSGQQILGNQLVLDIDALWDDLDLLYVFATDGDSDFAKINWIDPGNFTATEVNSPTFTVNEGFSNTGTSYLSTGWDPATNAVNFALNDAGVFAYCGTDITAANTFLFGSSDSGAVGRVELVPKRLTGENHLFGINSTGTAARGTGPVSSEGFFHIRRTATNDLRIFKDGAQVGTTESFTGTTGPNNDDIYLLATNSNGVVNSHILADIGIFGIGSSLSGQESAIYTAWNTYFTSL
jgi:hypothetical protein